MRALCSLLNRIDYRIVAWIRHHLPDTYVARSQNDRISIMLLLTASYVGFQSCIGFPWQDSFGTLIGIAIISSALVLLSSWLDRAFFRTERLAITHHGFGHGRLLLPGNLVAIALTTPGIVVHDWPFAMHALGPIAILAASSVVFLPAFPRRVKYEIATAGIILWGTSFAFLSASGTVERSVCWMTALSVVFIPQGFLSRAMLARAPRTSMLTIQLSRKIYNYFGAHAFTVGAVGFMLLLATKHPWRGLTTEFFVAIPLFAVLLWVLQFRFATGEQLRQSPIIYLRSFSDPSPRSAFRLVASAARNIGPVVALVRVDQRPSRLLGRLQGWVLFEYLADETEWKERVDFLLRICGAAIIDLTFPTEGVSYEEARAREMLPSEKIVVLRRDDRTEDPWIGKTPSGATIAEPTPGVFSYGRGMYGDENEHSSARDELERRLMAVFRINSSRPRGAPEFF